jgi:predicted metal-binding membrane protein
VTMVKAALETVLRRDRIVVAAALAGLAALAWGYVLWLGADVNMGGMTGFRMIPAGLGIMAPANAPWKAIEFAFVFAMWAVMMVGMMAPSAAPMILMVRPRGSPQLFSPQERGCYFLEVT